MNTYKHNRLNLLRRIMIYSIIGMLVLIVLLPYAWLLLDSFKERVDRFAIPPKIFFPPTLNNYLFAFIDGNFFQNMINSLIIALCSTAISLVFGVPAAYAMSVKKSRLGTIILFITIMTRIVPELAIVVPLYNYFHILGLFGKHLGIILAHVLYNIAFVVLLMKNFFEQIPKEINDSALVDGCTPLNSFLRLSLPLAAPGLSATAIFCIIMSWDEFVYSFILSSESTKTLPVAIPTLITLFGAKWGQAIAVSVVTMIPIIIFAFIIQRALIRGLTSGAVKG